MINLNDSSNRNGFDGNEIIIYATIASLIISKDLNINELNILGNFFEAVGQNLLTLAAYKSSSPNNNCNNSGNNSVG